MKNKKGVLGMDTVGLVLISLLVIAVISIATFLAVVNLRDSVETLDKSTTVLVNSTSNSPCGNTSGCYPSGITLLSTTTTHRNCALTVTCVQNSSAGGTCINSANYTITGCLISGAGTAPYANVTWNITGSYTYSNPQSNDLTQNITLGPTKFFQNAPVFFTLLGVIVLILIVAIVIVAVSRFTGGGVTGESGSRGGMSEEI